MVRALACHVKGCEFETRLSRTLFLKFKFSFIIIIIIIKIIFINMIYFKLCY